eukprot:Phypoly_transcript_15875.p1 GENE.Phypoly_transcript_15875~~Phypoly_transcript_15875.p1  ORF type:complete len:101 (+),score=24.56 Phypoly_transcript_15875:545-847(+)
MQSRLKKPKTLKPPFISHRLPSPLKLSTTFLSSSSPPSSPLSACSTPSSPLSSSSPSSLATLSLKPLFEQDTGKSIIVNVDEQVLDESRSGLITTSLPIN